MKARLLAGAAVLALLASPALAQTPAPPPTPADADLAGLDGLEEGGLFLEAESIIEDRANNTLTARGNVTARYEQRTLRAQEIIYDTVTGRVIARGNAEILQPDGTVQYADEIELDDQLRAGVAVGFAARQEYNAKIAAATAVRRSETVNELNRAIFTPCEICTPAGKPKQPTWSIQAEKIVQDRDRQLVYYRNAVVKAFGVPVFYTPVLWHADPTAERQSGFLMPDLTVSDRRGVSYEQPYLWVISPYQDVVISPQINTKVNPFLNVDWRKRFWSGLAQARGGVTHEQLFDSDGDRYGEDSTRSYILADGDFQLTPAWRWGFTAERVSDDTLFNRYDIDDVYEDRGYFRSDRRRLTSQAYAIRQTERSFLSVSAVSFQSLRPTYMRDRSTGGPDFSECDPTPPIDIARCIYSEDEGFLPVAAPLVEARWEPRGNVLGGRLRLQADAVALTRAEDAGGVRVEDGPGGRFYTARPGNPNDPGLDMARAGASLDWRRSITTRGGVRFEPFLEARGDVYRLQDLDVGGEDESFGRLTGTAGIDVRYPLIRRTAWGSVILEPMAQLAISPEAELDLRRPNEDGLWFEVDETNLFRADRLAGADLHEGGARVTVGGQATINWGEDRFARGFVGRSFRADDAPALRVRDYTDPLDVDPAIPNTPRVFNPTGLADRSSDWILAGAAKPFANLSLWGRARIDDAGNVRRGEAAANWDFDRARGFLRYVVDKDAFFDNPEQPGYFPTFQEVEDLQVGGEVLVTRNWGVTFDATRDLNNNLWRRSEIGLLYLDECTRIELVYERNETELFGFGRSESVLLRLNLATLGDAGYKRYDER